MKTVFNILILNCLLSLFSCVASKSSAPSQVEPLVFGYINPNTFQLYDVSEDVKYGYTSDFPIQVGGRNRNDHVLNQRRYLNALTGPEGQSVTYKQLESCCYEKKNIQGDVLLTYLDRYEISYEGNPQRFIIFIDTFERSKMYAPKGFAFKTKNSTVDSKQTSY